MEETPLIYAPSKKAGRLHRGEIVSGLVQAHLDVEHLSGPKYVVVERHHPLAVVMTQDCDLESDYRERARTESQPCTLPNILFCEVDFARSVRQRDGINSKLWNTFCANKNERYHYLRDVAIHEDLQGEGLEPLGIDFKRYFTIATNEVYRRLEGAARRRCRLIALYREHLESRFWYFQQRVGLPEEHYTKERNS